MNEKESQVIRPEIESSEKEALEMPIDVIILKNIFRRAMGEDPIPMPSGTNERVSTRFPKPLK